MIAASMGRPDRNKSKRVKKKLTNRKYPATISSRAIRAFNISERCLLRQATVTPHTRAVGIKTTMYIASKIILMPLKGDAPRG